MAAALWFSEESAARMRLASTATFVMDAEQLHFASFKFQWPFPVTSARARRTEEECGPKPCQKMACVDATLSASSTAAPRAFLL